MALTIVVDVGDHWLRPDTPGQIIELFATGGDQVTGMDLRARIGPDTGGSGSGGPVFQAVDFNGGEGASSIWEAFPTTVIGEAPVTGSPDVAQIGILFNNSGDAVAAEGLIARLVIDTTGVSEGAYPLSLDDPLIGRSTEFILEGPVFTSPTIVSGQLRIITHPWHHAAHPADVNADGNVFPIDALLVINELNRRGVGPLPVPVTADDQPPPFLDVMPDNQLQPIDALLVINELNARPAEGETRAPRDQRPLSVALLPAGKLDRFFEELGQQAGVRIVQEITSTPYPLPHGARGPWKLFPGRS